MNNLIKLDSRSLSKIREMKLRIIGKLIKNGLPSPAAQSGEGEHLKCSGANSGPPQSESRLLRDSEEREA